MQSTSNSTIIERGPLRFMISDAPSNNNINQRVKEFHNNKVTHCIRLCQETYDCKLVEREGIKFYDWAFEDGKAPPNEIIKDWLNLVNQVFPPGVKNDGGTIAIHCVAGLGRAPLLVAIALIERCSMDAFEAVKFIRDRRRGAINALQLQFLEKYCKKKDKCTIM
ncbi:protein tyrosine phosphatase [Acrasis kona]|uniref:Protein tyrosine phosphatase PRL-1 n=1 Tax=Acrasis kona TaxID=1008807 RepID=A0AAW2ZM43_9EUKA